MCTFDNWHELIQIVFSGLTWEGEIDSKNMYVLPSQSIYQSKLWTKHREFVIFEPMYFLNSSILWNLLNSKLNSKYLLQGKTHWRIQHISCFIAIGFQLPTRSRSKLNYYMLNHNHSCLKIQLWVLAIFGMICNQLDLLHENLGIKCVISYWRLVRFSRTPATCEVTVWCVSARCHCFASANPLTYPWIEELILSIPEQVVLRTTKICAKLIHIFKVILFIQWTLTYSIVSEGTIK